MSSEQELGLGGSWRNMSPPPNLSFDLLCTILRSGVLCEQIVQGFLQGNHFGYYRSESVAISSQLVCTNQGVKQDFGFKFGGQLV